MRAASLASVPRGAVQSAEPQVWTDLTPGTTMCCGLLASTEHAVLSSSDHRARLKAV